MAINFEDLLAAERQGRMIASTIFPRPGQKWTLNAGTGSANATLFVLARWADRFGAAVKVRAPAGLTVSPAAAAALETCRLLGLCSESRSRDAVPPGHLMIQSGGRIQMLESVPDNRAVWGAAFSFETGSPFVRSFSKKLPVLAVSEIREIDHNAIAKYKMPGVCLMENAAIGVVHAARSMVDGVSSNPEILVAAGGGNNGGDGLAAARGLTAIGINVKVALFVKPSDLKGDAAVNYRLLEHRRRCEIASGPDAQAFLEKHAQTANLVLDAVAGTGLRGKLRPDLAKAVETINASGLPALAVDVPSGLDADTGDASGPVVKARFTVTFGALKKGFFRGAGPKCSGQIFLADIGAPRAAYKSAAH